MVRPTRLPRERLAALPAPAAPRSGVTFRSTSARSFRTASARTSPPAIGTGSTRTTSDSTRAASA